MLDILVMIHLLASYCFKISFTKNYMPLLPPSAFPPLSVMYNTHYKHYIMYETTNLLPGKHQITLPTQERS